MLSTSSPARSVGTSSLWEIPRGTPLPATFLSQDIMHYKWSIEWLWWLNKLLYNPLRKTISGSPRIFAGWSFFLDSLRIFWKPKKTWTFRLKKICFFRDLAPLDFRLHFWKLRKRAVKKVVFRIVDCKSVSGIVTLLHEKINRKIDRYFPLVIIANCVDSLLTMETAGKCFQKILKGEWFDQTTDHPILIWFCYPY